MNLVGNNCFYLLGWTPLSTANYSNEFVALIQLVFESVFIESARSISPGDLDDCWVG